MTRFLLLRHGHVEGVLPKRFRGRMDLPLTPTGQRQARDAADYVGDRYAVDAVYSSPLRRCMASAQEFAERLRLPAAQPLAGLTDIDYGRWQGRLASEVEASEPELHALWRRRPEAMAFPEGETLAGVAARSLAALQELTVTCVDRTVAIFTHDSVLRVLLLGALGAPLSAYHRVVIDLCSLSELVYDGADRIDVARINERTGAAPHSPHLS
jgi:probable phosphoglycerate mutase